MRARSSNLGHLLASRRILSQVVGLLYAKWKRAFNHLAGIYMWQSEHGRSVNGKFLVLIFLEHVIALPRICIIVASHKNGWNWVSGCRVVGWIIFRESEQILSHKWQQTEIVLDWQLVLIWKKQRNQPCYSFCCESGLSGALCSSFSFSLVLPGLLTAL